MSGLTEAALVVITLGVMLLGLVGLLVPAVPGLLIVWLAALGYGLAAGFGTWGYWLFALITLLGIAGAVVDNLFTAAGAKMGGASWWSVLAAGGTALVGFFLFPPFGGIAGGLLGVMLVEFYRLRDWRKAWAAAKGMALGCGGGVLARLIIGALMIAAWGVWVRVS